MKIFCVYVFCRKFDIIIFFNVLWLFFCDFVMCVIVVMVVLGVIVGFYE